MTRLKIGVPMKQLSPTRPKGSRSRYQSFLLLCSVDRMTACKNTKNNVTRCGGSRQCSSSGYPADLKPMSKTHHTTPIEVPSDFVWVKRGVGEFDGSVTGPANECVSYLCLLRNFYGARIDCFVVALRECPSTGGTMLITIDY